jgi:HK97 family phage major capsid protein/HK97 family phage prohead protease
MTHRAYSLLTVRAVNEDQRVIRGTATTPTPDRMGDIVEPLGVSFKNPLPLLHQHNAREPVGTVKFAKPTADGIDFEAQLPVVVEPGPLKDRVDTAWGEVKLGLVRGVSIGFRSIEMSFMEDGGIRFIQSEVLELSLVTIPANAEATIQAVKSVDAALLAASGRGQPASGRNPPGASGQQRPVKLGKDPTMKTIAEQIAALEETRGKKAARMNEVMQKSMAENRSTDQAEQEEFDTLSAEVDKIDEDIGRLRVLEKAMARTARPVVTPANEAEGSAARAAVVVRNSEKVAPGIRFARVVKCLGLAQGNIAAAAQIAEQRFKNDDQVISVLKTGVAAGAIVGPGWMGDLVGDETSVFADFVDFLRPMTILGKFGANGIPALRRVPFRTALISQTTGGSGYWVGEGKAKPLTAFSFDRTTLVPLKCANIAVATMESLRDSSPSAETLLRDQLAMALRATMDADFIDPANGGSSNVKPAAITNGVSAITSSGNDADAVRADIKAIFSAFIAANNAPTTGVWVMSATTALALSLMVNALGQREFAQINMNGGTLEGLPVITSEFAVGDSSGGMVALINAGDVWYGDDGDVAVDMSNQASLEMADDASHDSITPSPAQLVSLWQTNSVGFRAERTINWKRRRDSAVALLETVNWGAS